jgi:hypothetical protein
MTAFVFFCPLHSREPIAPNRERTHLRRTPRTVQRQEWISVLFTGNELSERLNCIGPFVWEVIRESVPEAQQIPLRPAHPKPHLKLSTWTSEGGGGAGTPSLLTRQRIGGLGEKGSPHFTPLYLMGSLSCRSIGSITPVWRMHNEDPAA